MVLPERDARRTARLLAAVQASIDRRRALLPDARNELWELLRKLRRRPDVPTGLVEYIDVVLRSADAQAARRR